MQKNGMTAQSAMEGPRWTKVGLSKRTNEADATHTTRDAYQKFIGVSNEYIPNKIIDSGLIDRCIRCMLFRSKLK